MVPGDPYIGTPPTLWTLIDRRADETPDALLMTNSDFESMTFGEYAVEVERTAAGLASYGVHAGSVVSWQLPTWNESLVLAGALARLGCVQNPILPILGRLDVEFICGQAGSDVLIVPSAFRGVDFESQATSVATVLSERDHRSMSVLVADRALPQGDPNVLEAPPASSEDVRWLFYTSGTTSQPKGARHTDAALVSVAGAMARRLAVTRHDRVAMVFPFTHIGGVLWLAVALETGCALLLAEVFDPESTPEMLSRERVTLAGAGTVFHQAYLDYQRSQLHPVFPDVRAFPGGGAPKPPHLVGEIRAAFDAPVLSGYGMTEAPVLTMAATTDAEHELARSEGKPMPGVEVRIVDGEVRVRAPQMMQGYVDATLDDEAFDEDGFFRTGDLGEWDDDGNLRITGRTKDVIIRKGENISAQEVEHLVLSHPSVDDVAVIGVPDPSSGERCCAVVCLAPFVEGLELDELVDYLKNEGMTPQKLPEQLEIVEVIPRNPTGKILKDELRAQFSG